MSRVEGEHLADGPVGAVARPGTFDAAHHALSADRTLQFQMKGVDPPPPPPNWLEPLLKALQAMGPVLTWVFWIIVALAVLAVAWLIVREVVKIRLPQREDRLNISDPLWRPEASVALALLADVDALAGKGLFAEAVHLLLARSIQDIDSRIPNTVRPALTARDIGALDRLPEAARPTFVHIARVVEASLFGGASVDHATFADCRDAYEAFAFPAQLVDAMSEMSTSAKAATGGFRPGVVLALVLAAVFSMSAMAVMSAWSPEMNTGDDGRDHALSKSAIGYGGLVRLLRGMDRTVVLSRGGLSGDGQDSLLILTPPAGREEAAMAALTGGDGDVLIVLPKWRTAPDPRRKGWVRSLGQLPPAAALTALPEDLRKDARLEVLHGKTSLRLMQGPRVVGEGLAITDLRTLSGPEWTPVVTDEAGRGIVVVHNRSALYVLTDPDLLNTLSLDDPAKARSAVAVIETLAARDRAIVFDLSLNGFSRPRSVLRLLLEPPLLGFTLCLFAAVLLIGWQAMIRFEPHLNAIRAVPPGKTALADNTAALARLARREHRMARPYAEVVRGLAARAVAAPQALGAEALTALLNRLAARHGGETTYEDLLARAEAARTPADLMSVAGALIRWKSEMTRGRD